MDVINYFLYGILVLFCLLILYNLLRKRDSNIIETMKEGGKHLPRKIPLIIFLTVIYLAVFIEGQLLDRLNKASLMIGLNYSAASSGLNPNNTRFNSTEVVSDEVLMAAIKNGGLQDVEPDDLRKAIHIYPVVAGEELSLDQFYISTEYRLDYERTDATAHLSPKGALAAVSQAYYDKFVNDYSRKTNVLQLDFENIQDEEYLDMDEYLDEKASEVEKYMWTMSDENSTFRSSATGETFGSIAQKVQDFRNVELERYSSYVLDNGLAKDVALYVSKLNYDNRNMNISFMKDLAAYKVRLETIDLYERDMARIVLVPTQDEMGQFYMSRTKLGVDDFADQAKSYKEYATGSKLEIEKNNNIINKILGSTAGESIYQHADGMLKTLEEDLASLADDAIQIVEEYNKKTMNNYMNIVEPNLSLAEKYNLKMGVLLSGIFLVILSLFFIVLPPANKKKKAFVRK